jgi:hypothetical protein
MLFGICDLALIGICLFHFPHVVDRPRFQFFVQENGKTQAPLAIPS